MRSSEEAAGGGRATVCAAAGRHQHATHVPVTSSVSKIWSFERTAYATPGGWEPPDKGTMPHGSAANWSTWSKEGYALVMAVTSNRTLLHGDPFSVYTRVLQTWVEGKKVFDFADPKDRLFAMGGFGASDGQAMSMCCFQQQEGQ